MILNSIDGWNLQDLDFLFIENVGNLVCPSAYDLGENLRVVLLSVTEGEDKPLKYPLAFATAHVAVISKIDLAAASDFNERAAIENIGRVHPNLPVFELSAKTGTGMEAWLTFLDRCVASKRAVPVR